MFGFAGATLVLTAAPRLGGNAWWGLFFIIVPFLKDATDTVVDIARTGKLKPVTPEPAGFKPSTRELLADAATDFFFWVAGALLAVLLGLLSSPAPAEYISKSPWSEPSVYLVVIAFFIVLFMLRGRWKYYTGEKTAFDNSKLPFYFRLPNFHGNFVDNNDIQVINNFLAGNREHCHLVITGPFASGRTTLATGIGCQLTTSGGPGQFTLKPVSRKPSSNDRKLVRYLTASRLFEQIQEFEQVATERNGSRQDLCLLQEADILIIDDILLAELPDEQVQEPRKLSYDDVGTPVPDRQSFPNAFRVLDNKPVVWVVSDPGQIKHWQDWINNNFYTQVNLSAIKLADASRVSGPQEFGFNTLPGVLAALTLLTGLVITVGSLLVILQADRLGTFVFWALLLGAISAISYLIYRPENAG